MMAMCVVVDSGGCGCGWRGGPGVRGFATVVMLIFGGWPKTFVRRTSAVYCQRGRPVGRLLRRRIVELLMREPGASGRLAVFDLFRLLLRQVRRQG